MAKHDSSQLLGSRKRRPGIRSLSGPVTVGLLFAAAAVALTLIGLWRDGNLSVRNVLLGAVLGGGTWGVISWAVATAVVQVEKSVASRKGEDD